MDNDLEKRIKELEQANTLLQKQLCREQEKLKIENEPTVRANIAYLVSQVNKLEQSSRDDKALIEKLVETIEYCGCHEHNGSEESNDHYTGTCDFCIKVDEALQLANSKGYGNKT